MAVVQTEPSLLLSGSVPQVETSFMLLQKISKQFFGFCTNPSSSAVNAGDDAIVLYKNDAIIDVVRPMWTAGRP
jgi:hypothetical protein